MCGWFSHSVYSGESEKKRSPLWRMSIDDRHITFYAGVGQCTHGTSWCKAHCHIKKLPANALIDIFPKYEIEYFLNPLKWEMKSDFDKADYVTMFGSGNVENQFLRGPVERAITEIATEHPAKTFRFFLRRVLTCEEIPENVRLVFSMDLTTDIDVAQWALKSKIVSSLAIVNHKDNRFLIDHFKTLLPALNCDGCSDTGYECFKKRDKNLLILKNKEI